METAHELVINLIQEKIDLYTELVSVLHSEADAIRSMQVDDLWRFSGEKQVTMRAIEGLREQLLSALTQMGIRHNMGLDRFSLASYVEALPKEIQMALEGRQDQLFLLKHQVQNFAEKNRQFVEEYLTVISDMITIITTPARKPGFYGQNRTLRYEDAGEPRVFHQEV